jgi:hypothetical protein
VKAQFHWDTPKGPGPEGVVVAGDARQSGNDLGASAGDDQPGASSPLIQRALSDHLPVGGMEGTAAGLGYVAEPGTVGDDETATPKLPPLTLHGSDGDDVDRPGSTTPKLQQSAAHGKVPAQDGHPDWIPVQAVGTEEPATEPFLENIVFSGEARGEGATDQVEADPTDEAEGTEQR